MSCILLVIEVLLILLTSVLAVVHFMNIPRYYKAGLTIGGIIFILEIPWFILMASGIDLNELSKITKIPYLSGEYAMLFIFSGFTLIFLFLIILIGWHMLVYTVAASEWEQVKEYAFPLLMKKPERSWSFMLPAILFGIVVSAISAIVFTRLQVEIGESLKLLLPLFKNVASINKIVEITITIGIVSGMALAEELGFRGVLLGLCMRLSRNNRFLIVFSYILVSLLWALLHFENTNSPLLKGIQIFLVGIVLCELTRRKGLEAAIAAHISLNAGSVIFAYYIFS